MTPLALILTASANDHMVAASATLSMIGIVLLARTMLASLVGTHRR